MCELIIKDEYCDEAKKVLKELSESSYYTSHFNIVIIVKEDNPYYVNYFNIQWSNKEDGDWVKHTITVSDMNTKHKVITEVINALYDGGYDVYYMIGTYYQNNQRRVLFYEL